MEKGYPPLPGAAAGYMQGCNQDLPVGELLFTADQMRAYATAAVAAELERCIEIVMRELDSNGQAKAIALAIHGWA